MGKILNNLKLGLAGLIFLGANITNTKAQYSQKGWVIVTESEFNRLKISEDSIQTVNLTKNKDSSRYTDNSKRGKKFTDTNGEKYFWVNPNPTNEIYSFDNHNHYNRKGNNFDRGREELNQPKYQTKKENLIDNSKIEEKNNLTEEQKLEALVNDPEIKNLIKDFNSSFQVEYPYAYLGEDITDKTGMLWKKGWKKIIPVELKEKYPEGTILKDKKTSKDILLIERVRAGLGIDLESFLKSIVITSDIKHVIKYTIGRRDIELSRNYKKELKTLEEKKDFIRPYFTDSIPNAIKNLPKYKAPLIYKEEWLMHLAEGKPVKYQNNIKFDDTKPAKSVDMNEQKLDEILKEGERK